MFLGRSFNKKNWFLTPLELNVLSSSSNFFNLNNLVIGSSLAVSPHNDVRIQETFKT